MHALDIAGVVVVILFALAAAIFGGLVL